MQTSEASLPRELTGHLTEVALGCQRMLEENPCHPQALVGITLVALASGQSEARCQDGPGRRGRRAADGHGLGRAGPGAQGRRPERGGGARLRASHPPGRHERRWPAWAWAS